MFFCEILMFVVWKRKLKTKHTFYDFLSFFLMFCLLSIFRLFLFFLSFVLLANGVFLRLRNACGGLEGRKSFNNKCFVFSYYLCNKSSFGFFSDANAWVGECGGCGGEKGERGVNENDTNSLSYQSYLPSHPALVCRFHPIRWCVSVSVHGSDSVLGVLGFRRVERHRQSSRG